MNQWIYTNVLTHTETETTLMTSVVTSAVWTGPSVFGEKSEDLIHIINLWSNQENLMDERSEFYFSHRVESIGELFSTFLL